MTTSTATTTRHPAVDRWVIRVIVTVLVVEAAVGFGALLAGFGPHLLATMAGRSATTWAFGWEVLQILVAVSLVPIALLVGRGERRGWFAAAVLQLVAVVVSGYHVAHTLPDSWALVSLVALTTVLLASRPVREWCLGPEAPAFEALVADR